MTASTFKELLAQRDALDQQIKEARARELSSAVARARDLVAEFGLKPQDVFASARRPSASKGAAVQPKYRDPKTGATWTGRGKAPTWIRDRDRSGFLIAS